MIKNKKGFTFIEIMMTITIMVMAGVFLYSFGSSSITKAGLRSSSNLVADTIKLAQSKALSGYLNSSWSVRLEADRLTIFVGEDFDTRDTSLDSVTLLDRDAEISEISLQGGGNDLVFDPFSGHTATYGTFKVTEGSGFATVEVNSKGIIIIN